MTTKPLVAVAILIALSVSAVKAQDAAPNSSAMSAAQPNEAVPSTDASSYGGTVPSEGATGNSTSRSRHTQLSCSPKPFCDIYSGGQ